MPAPKHYRRAERKLRRLQRRLSRCSNGSTGREQARRAVARHYLKLANQRKDHLHKLSSRLVGQYDAIVVEDLAVAALAKTKLGKSVLDAAWGQFRFQLTYKARWNRKHLVVIRRFFPSSRLCAACGAINGELTLSEREWKCGAAGPPTTET